METRRGLHQVCDKCKFLCVGGELVCKCVFLCVTANVICRETESEERWGDVCVWLGGGIIDMMPFICFKMEPPENKFHHQGLSYTKLCRGVFVSTCVSVRAVREQVSEISPPKNLAIWSSTLNPKRERVSQGKRSVFFCQ